MSRDDPVLLGKLPENEVNEMHYLNYFEIEHGTEVDWVLMVRLRLNNIYCFYNYIQKIKLFVKLINLCIKWSLQPQQNLGISLNKTHPEKRCIITY